MKQSRLLNQILLILLVSLVASCGGGYDLPPLRPTGEVSGKILDGALKNATLRIFSLSAGEKSEKLGEAVPDAEGNYSLSIRAKSQVILLEVSGGTYVEQSSAKEVPLKEGEVLRAVAFYSSGKPLSLMITPATHIVSGYAMYKMATGIDPATAVSEALAEISDIFLYDVNKTEAVSILGEDTETSVPGNSLINGFFLAGVSAWTEWVSVQQTSEPHDKYYSMAFYQLMYDDVVADGLLDGRGEKNTNSEAKELFYGLEKIGPDVYRTRLAQYMLAMANNPVNRTAIKASDLLDYTLAYANNLSPLFGNNEPGEFQEAAPTVFALEQENIFKNDQFHFTVSIGGIIGAESVAFYIDGNYIGDADDPLKPFINIDTKAFSDGSHELKVVATNIFDKSAEGNFTYRFDNTSPTTTVDAPVITNQAVYSIFGKLSDAGSGVKSLLVQGEPVTLLADNAWSASVQLVPGKNEIPLKIEDQLGNVSLQNVNIYLDQTAPVFNAPSVHSQATFAQKDGVVQRQLEDENLNEPIVIDAGLIDLNGSGINRQSLDSNNIPFFAFTTSDPQVSGVSSKFEELTVFLQYSKNGEVLSPWKKINSVEQEYLVPIVTESLHLLWAQSNKNDEHIVDVKVIDNAGNEAQKQFSFKVDFRVSDIDPSTLSIATTDVFKAYDAAGFAGRSALNNQKLSVVRYRYTNNADYAKYIQLNDDGDHKLQRYYDEAVRVNKVKWRTTTQWRIKTMVNTLSSTDCPVAKNDAWVPITEVYNYSNASGKFDLETLPPSTMGDFAEVFTDAPQSYEEGWVPFHFDQVFLTRVKLNTSGTQRISYDFDYVIDINAFTIEPAMVSNWKLTDVNTQQVIKTCEDVSFLEQNLVYDPIAQNGYPQNQLSENLQSSPISFQTDSFTVEDVEDGLLTAINGWFRISPGHTVWVNKIINNPDLDNYNDTDVLDLNNFTSYQTHRMDRQLEWTINQQLRLQVIHDAGEQNIVLMTPKVVDLSAPDQVYKISR